MKLNPLKDFGSIFERMSGGISVADSKYSKPIAEEKEESEMGELAVDVFETPTEIVIKAMVAGVHPNDLDISITREMVTIRGKRHDERTMQGDDYFYKELYWGSFSRSIVLPQEIDVDEASATQRNGLLTLKLPKIDKKRAAKLKIKYDE